MIFWISLLDAPSHHCTVAWVTRPERPKGAKDEVKQALGPNAGPKGRKLEVGAQRAPRLLVTNNIRREI